ncbi:hypothetical protein N4R57_06145 [Rhodobacteraceae bacterium D3-12]|nr:hypothetical protein N4R57_06145 [Rhodobacteraceae bacterium D3-12]
MRSVSAMAIVLCGLAGCTDFPDLGDAVAPGLDSAAFPKLVPVEPLLAQTEEVQITPQSMAGIDGRIARLKARAARLRGRVVDTGTRARMQDGVAPVAAVPSDSG